MSHHTLLHMAFLKQYGAGEMALQKSVVQFLAPTWGSLQLPITLAPANPTSSSELQGVLHICVQTHTHTPMKTNLFKNPHKTQ